MTTFLAKLNKNGLDWETEYQASRWMDFVSRNQNKWVRIEPVKSGRSLRQNNYYWLVLETIANHTGHYAEELHRLFKGLYLPQKKLTYKGKDYQMSGSTTELSKSDFVEYMFKIQAEAASLGVILPDPKDFVTKIS